MEAKVVRKMNLADLTEESKKIFGTTVNEDYTIDFSNSMVTASFSRKILIDRYEPSEVHISIQAPVSAKSREGLEASVKELLRIVKSAADPYIRKLEDLKEANRRRD